jgi:glycogen(starch) synthase
MTPGLPHGPRRGRSTGGHPVRALVIVTMALICVLNCSFSVVPIWIISTRAYALEVPVSALLIACAVVMPRISFPRTARLALSRRNFAALSLRAWIRVCGAASIMIATLPSSIVSDIVPARHGNVASLLPWIALSGFAVGGINLGTTLLRYAGPDWRKSFHGFAWQCAIVAIPGLALLFLRGKPVPWLIAALIGEALPALRALQQYGSSLVNSQRPRVLHLAFEDPKRPGAGGGSVRTLEIDRRLADSYEITAVCARYQGCKARVEDGVRYVHVGLPWGQKFSFLAYFACVPWALVRYPSELVVEDFAAPFSSVAVPWLTSRPVVGMVQWLFAQEKAAEYRLPFHVVEKIGLSSHTSLVAVSEDLAAQLRSRNQRAQVQVIENALPEEAFVARSRPRRDILFLGRLEMSQKGVDLLVESFASIADRTDRLLVIAGSGLDERRIRELVDARRIRDRVKFVGHVPPEDRFDLLASAEVVAMPSRYETFGMVAAESLAVETPVVAFDIPCLRSVVSTSGGILVPAFDTNAFGDALLKILRDETLKLEFGRSGKESVSHLRWDGMAVIQRDYYEKVMVSS